MFSSTHRLSYVALILAAFQLVTPANAVANVSPRAVDGSDGMGLFTKRDSPTTGCGAFGPLTDSRWGTMERFCNKGEKWTCEVKDKTGCAKGDPANVQSFTIVDSINRQDLAGGAAQTSITGACTDNGMIKCVLQLSDGSVGEKYSMTFQKSS